MAFDIPSADTLWGDEPKKPASILEGLTFLHKGRIATAWCKECTPNLQKAMDRQHPLHDMLDRMRGYCYEFRPTDDRASLPCTQCGLPAYAVDMVRVPVE